MLGHYCICFIHFFWHHEYLPTVSMYSFIIPFLMTVPCFIVYEFPNGTSSLLLNVQVVNFFFFSERKKAGMSYFVHKPVKVSISSETRSSLILTWTMEEIPTSSPCKLVCMFPRTHTHTDTHTLEPRTVPRLCPTWSLAQSSFSSGVFMAIRQW